MVKHVVIFGASSRTGVCAVNAAIEKGLNVRVSLDSKAENLKGCRGPVELLAGDVLDIQHIKTALECQNAIIVVLESEECPDTSSVTCEGMKNIVAVMELLRIKVICVCFKTHSIHQYTQTTKGVLEQDEIRTFRVLEGSNLHWVAVVAPRVTDGSATGYTIVRSRSSTRHPAPAVTRADLAKFLVDCLAMPERYQKSVEIASLDKR